MRGNHTIESLYAEVHRIDEAKIDYVVNTKALLMRENDMMVAVVDPSGNDRELVISDHAHSQIAERTRLGSRVYNDVLTIEKGLRADTVNRLWRAKPEKRLVRELDDEMRAFLSNRFRPIDNLPIIDCFAGAVKDRDIKLESTSLTDKHMIVQARFNDQQSDVDGKGPVFGGISLRNSEVGAGALAIEFWLYRQVCSNGLVLRHESESVMRKYHVGRQLEGYLSDETVRYEIAALEGQMRDAITYIANGELFQNAVDRIATASGITIPRPEKAIEIVTKRFALTESDGESILSRMVGERDFSVWGLVNAVTAQAHGTNDRERQYEYERIGGDIFSAKGVSVKELVEAA